MASSKKVELIDQAIQALQTEKRDHNDQLLLSNLLSELESLKEVKEMKEEGKEVDGSCCSDKLDAEEVLKELKEMRKQNVVTHCLLSAMIVLTLAWQVSEVSIILMVKHGLKNPFRSLGRLLSLLLNPPGQGAEDRAYKEENGAKSGLVPALQIAEVDLE